MVQQAHHGFFSQFTLSRGRRTNGAIAEPNVAVHSIEPLRLAGQGLTLDRSSLFRNQNGLTAIGLSVRRPDRGKGSAQITYDIGAYFNRAGIRIDGIGGRE